MNNEQITQLGRIYNTLMLIETKGDNTVLMAECLSAIKQLYIDIQNNKQGE